MKPVLVLLLLVCVVVEEASAARLKGSCLETGCAASDVCEMDIALDGPDKFRCVPKKVRCLRMCVPEQGCRLKCD